MNSNIINFNYRSNISNLFTDGSLLKLAFDTVKKGRDNAQKSENNETLIITSVGHFLFEKSDIRICVECFYAYPVVFNSSTVIGI